VQAAFLNGSDSFREWRGWPPAGSGPLPIMIILIHKTKAPAALWPGRADGSREGRLTTRGSKAGRRSIARALPRVPGRCRRRGPGM